MPPVIANGGYYGAPGVTAAGAYGSTPADMLYSLRNQGWSDQQIMDVYGANDPMVRIMQLENRWNQTRPGAGGYRYQYPTRATTPARRPTAQAQAQQRAAGPSMNTMARTARSVAGMVPGGQQPAAQQSATQPAAQPATQPAAQPATQPAAQPATQPAAQPAAQQNPVGSYGASPLAARLAQQRAAAAAAAPTMDAQQTFQFEQALANPFQPLPDIGSYAPSYRSTADDYYAPRTGAGVRIKPWTPSVTYGGSALNMPPQQPTMEQRLREGLNEAIERPWQPGPVTNFFRRWGDAMFNPQEDFQDSTLGQTIFNSMTQYR